MEGEEHDQTLVFHFLFYLCRGESDTHIFRTGGKMSVLLAQSSLSDLIMTSG